MTITWTIPCHRRVKDLASTLPQVIAAANAHPPVEIVLLDYANPEPLPRWEQVMIGSSTLRVVTYRGRDHYHSAHARNLTIRAATGDVVVIASSDIEPRFEFFPLIRQRMAETEAVWLRPDVQFVGVIACQRQALLEAGGFDERIEFYGSEDKELAERLARRGLACASYDASSVLAMLRTTNQEKIRNYRLPMSKIDMMRHGSAILKENRTRGLLVANEGKDWGAL
jgi:hypothetical protein